MLLRPFRVERENHLWNRQQRHRPDEDDARCVVVLRACVRESERAMCVHQKDGEDPMVCNSAYVIDVQGVVDSKVSVK